MWVQCTETSTWLGCAENSPEGFVTLPTRQGHNKSKWCCMTKNRSLSRHYVGEMTTTNLPRVNVIERNGWQDKTIRIDVAREVTDNIASVFAAKPSHQELNESITHLCNKSDDGEHWHQCEWGENVNFSAWKLVGDDVKQVEVQHAPPLHFKMHV